MADFMKEFESNKRPIGRVEGYSEERSIETKRAMRDAKVVKQNERSEKKGRTE